MGQSVLSPIAIKGLQPSAVISTTTSWRSSPARLSCHSNAVSSSSAHPLHDARQGGTRRRRILPHKEQSVRCRRRELGISLSRDAIEYLPKTRLSSGKALSALSSEKVAETEIDEGSSLSAENPNENGAAVIDGIPTPRFPSYQRPELAARWEAIHGRDNWKDLLNPLDPVLRSELIRYGEFAQSTYDVFDFDERTRFCGSCRFSKERLLEQAQILDSGYEVTDYIYSLAGDGVPKSFFKFLSSDNANQLNVDLAWSREANWQGYVAVTTDPAEIKRLGRRDILVAWRGTITSLEWLHNLQDKLVPAEMDPRRVHQSGNVDLKIEQGFLKLYVAKNKNSPYTQQSARMQVLTAVCRLVRKYRNEKLSITVTGHSLGAALAVISAYDIAESGVNQPEHLPDHLKTWGELDVKKNPDDVVEWTRNPRVKTVPVSVVSFAGPRVGNNAFRDRMEELKVKVIRVVNKNDLVPKVPGLLVNEKTTWLDFLLEPVRAFLEALPWTYIHVGEAFEIDSKASPFLKDSNHLGDFHNLEASYLHVLSGYRGADEPFKPLVPRDLALVNKASALLLSKYFIPEHWWYQQYKGLVRVKKNGVWATFPREREDYPDFYDPSKAEAEALEHATPSTENS